MAFPFSGWWRSVYARVINGNVIQGDVTFQQSVERPPSEPDLPWLTELDTGTRDSDLLSWHARLTPLLGRDAEMDATLAWATGAGEVKARFVSGAGGIGKSRFAAEVAENLRAQGWKAGFIDLRRDMVLPVFQAGLLLIIDYPEENRSAVRRLLEDLGRHRPGNGQKIRVLLLSRRGEEVWGDDVAQADASNLFSRIEVPPLRPVHSVADAFTLFCGAVERLAGLRGVKVAPVERATFERWFSGNDLHRLPLFLTAAAVQTVNAPDVAALSLSGREVIDALVMRERRRAVKESVEAGLPENALPRLYALAAIRDGLDTATLRRLADPALCLGVGAAEELIDRLARTGRLEDGTLPKPQPDIMAAAFLVQELARRPQDAPEWLWATMSGDEAGSLDRAARLAHDAEVVLGIHKHRLTSWLTTMLDGRPDRCVPLDEWASDGTHGPTMPAVAGAVAMTLGSVAKDDAEKARCLTNGSNYLSAVGDGLGALRAIQEAVDIRQKLAEAVPARFLPDLALSLNNLSIASSEAGDGSEALRAIQKAVEYYRKLAEATPSRFLPDLASSLSNLSIYFSEAGEGSGALKAIQEAVSIWRKLAEATPSRFLPDFAMSLNNLSVHLSAAGDRSGALMAIQESVEHYRRLTEAVPARFLSDLAGSLNNLSNRLSDAGDGPGALRAIQEAVSIRRKLAQSVPRRYEHDLAGSLAIMARLIAASGTPKDAIPIIEEAIKLIEPVAKANTNALPARWHRQMLAALEQFKRNAEGGDA
ncbi:tetratricopeptide repeat protein [Azospirillum brasilense]|uniref:tetratricopeptide repeat protein n=1 Tax=Azospirillum brasilense TaxID=192 RepID=UPI00190BB7B6|nr:tetratricopeptide repeat protein [Azospirillum brasilense]MBK3735146.1 tetratricopeptide repeat protein [Azospirillum brasilense]